MSDSQTPKDRPSREMILRVSQALEILADDLEESPSSVHSRERARQIRELASLPPPGIAREVTLLSRALPTTWPSVISLAIVTIGFVTYLVLK